MGLLCIFTGHRLLPADPRPLAQALRQKIIRLTEAGYTDFACGGAMGFDLLAAEAVLALKPADPRLRLLMILPCHGQDRSYRPADRARYARILAQADAVRYTAEQYYEGCMLVRDRVLAQAADCCVCYLTRSRGGTAYTVRQAAVRDVPIYNLAEALSAGTKED